MAKDLGKMNRDDLVREREEAERRLQDIRKAESEYDGRRKSELRAEIEKMLSAEGYSVADIFGAAAAKASKGKGRAKGAAKFRHPENPQITWTGKGRQPAWYRDHVEKGGNPEDLAA